MPGMLMSSTSTEQSASSEAEQAEGSAADNGEKIEIRFTEWDGGDTLAVYEQIAENFKNSQDEIHVTVMNIPDEYDTKITSMIAGNDVPEICLLNADTLMYQYAEQGIVLNLLDFIENDREISPFYSDREMAKSVQEIYNNPLLKTLYESARELADDDLTAINHIVKKLSVSANQIN